ncbi:MAG: hypothetical protein IKI58_09805 [Oscillospiraceae bacterium]|nr:hypothetical protein [Oscillospiraceae bacterium]
MRFLIKAGLFTVLFLVMMHLFGMNCFADTSIPEGIAETLHETDLEIPSDTQDALSDFGVSVEEPESVLSLSPSDYLHHFTGTLKKELRAPFVLLFSLLSLTLLSSLLSGLGDTVSDSGMRRLVEMLCAIVCTAGAAKPLCTCLERTASTLENGQAFMLSFIPVFSAFLAAGGHVASGATYQLFILFLTETVMQIANSFLFPLLQMSAAIGIADAIHPELRLGGFVSGFKKIITWTLGTFMALFSALLSVRSFVAVSADSLASKSVKLLSSSLIPIIGGAVSDAYGTVQGSIRLVRNGTGAAGILIILCMIMPALVSLILFRAIFAFSGVFAEIAGTKSLSALFQNIQSVLSAAFALLICFSLMLIFSCAVMLLLTGGSN